MPFAVQATQKKLRPFDRALYLCNMGVLHILRSLVGLLGRKRTLQLGRLLGRMLYAVAGRLRKKMLLNLDLAFGDGIDTAPKKADCPQFARAFLCQLG